MRPVSIVLCIALVALNGFSLSPASGRLHWYVLAASLVIALVLLVLMFVTPGQRTEPKIDSTEAPNLVPVPATSNHAEAEIVRLLAILQERGRLVDFLMEDIRGYDDAQVGAAARVVHEGCKATLQEHFGIRSIREESEGSSVTIPAGYAADEYRFIGNIRGAGPFTGTLVHRGWKTEAVKLPRIVRLEADRLPTIAPAEVELK